MYAYTHIFNTISLFIDWKFLSNKNEKYGQLLQVESECAYRNYKEIITLTQCYDYEKKLRGCDDSINTRTVLTKFRTLYITVFLFCLI